MSEADAKRAAWKAEQQRQANAYAAAINETLAETARQFTIPIMNSAAGGCVGVLGAMLASIPDGRNRRALYDAILKGLRTEFQNAPAKAAARVHGAAQTLDMSRFQ